MCFIIVNIMLKKLSFFTVAHDEVFLSSAAS